jgi:hypothetical protein
MPAVLDIVVICLLTAPIVAVYMDDTCSCARGPGGRQG